MERINPKRAQTPSPDMQRAAALCGLGALAYLAAESALSGLLGPSVEGLPPAAGELVALGKNLLALAAPFLLVLACPPGAPVRLRRPRRGMLPVLFVLFWGLTMAGNLASSGLQALLGEAGGAELADAPAALVWLRLALVPAVGEELLFRGLMQGYLRPWGSRAAVWGQAVLFALLHGDAPACLSALLSGLALGLCAETSGSLLPGMAFHLYNNTLALLSQTGAGSAWVQPLLLFGLPAAALMAWAIKPGRPPRLQGTGAGVLIRCPGYGLAVVLLAMQMLHATFT